ncbi:MAG: hypothetical protein BGO37_01560 [Cellulomonas sp. 73-92]|uniref:HPr family phosphocarrier protein n=1 Tax=Cellulomonas sp. 73-92 TaxID=1895740 RepID=UPI00092A9E13|nr:HPr family phosphocarrier protein [Cellulomonas sp. 73-92]OJV75538.1 MAG: hypothetical protein BGO37_01560 [Cellulomonas sp. 73-92]
MTRRRATIATASGLHARPAALVTQLAASGGVPVLLGRVGQPPVDATSILMLMGLRLEHGDEVELTAEGEGAERLLAELGALLETDLDAVPASR